MTLFSFSQQSDIYLSKNLDFISHENNIGCVASLIRSSVSDITLPLTVYYTVSGNGINEASISTGSAVIPANERYIEIPVNPINNPNSISADRQININIIPNSSYNILRGSIEIAIKDNLPLRAFPTAVGGGAYATGGRGGNIYHVTNLLDDGSEGSFRWALDQPRPATIVFDVAGIINMPNALNIGGHDLTIAAQSAPQGGVTLTYPASGRININDGNNIITRFLKVRPQFQGEVALAVKTGNGEDSFGSNLIFDHTSISYGSAGFSVTGHDTYNITFQNGLIGECNRGGLFGNSQAYFANYSYNNTFTQSMFYNISHRLPNTASGRSDIYNNVIYDWINRWTTVKANAQVNHFNNFYFKGNKTSLFYQWQNNSPKWFVNGVTNEDPSIPPRIYSAGNIAQDLFMDPNADNTQTLWIEHAYSSQTERVEPELFTDTRYAMIGYTPQIMTAVEASIAVPQDAGAYKYLNADGSFGIHRDAQDTRYVSNTINDTPEEWGTGTGTNGHHSSVDGQPYADFLTLITGNPTNTRPDNFYNPEKSEHIPEQFYDLYMSPGDTHNDIAPSGYTWMEEYLNSVDRNGTSVAIGVVGVEVEPGTANLQMSETMSLTTTFTPTDASNKTGTWSSSDEDIAIVDANGLVTPISEGVVTITFTTNDGGFTDTSQITVFYEALQASAGNDQQICEGESTTLLASGGTNYLWNTGATTASIEITPEITTTYTVTVSNDNNQSEDASVTITVKDAPIAYAGEDQSICQGESVSLTATGGTSYLWNTGETTATIEVNPEVETIYSVEVSNDECSSTDEVIIFVNEIPEITVSEDSVIMKGETITLYASGSDNYQWSTGETTTSIEVTPLVTTTYTVTTINDTGCQSNSNVTVTVIPELVINAGEDVSICNGETVTLSATGGASYTWSTGDIGPELIINPTETTTYTVTIEDAYGYTDTDEVTVFVNEAPQITVTNDLVIVNGESVVLNASGSDNYLWNTGETTDSITVNPNITTTYTVTTNGTGECSSSADIIITVIPEITAYAGEDQTICNGETVTLSASGGSTYIWNTGDNGSELTVNPTITTTYTVTVEDDYGYTDTDTITVFVNEMPTITTSDDLFIMIGDSATLSVNGANTFTWNTGETTSEIMVSPEFTTTYTVIGESEQGCQSSAEITVTVVEQINANAGEDISICIGESVTLNASGGITYTWNTGETGATPTLVPAETTTYTVTVTDGFGNSDSDDVTVTVNPIPTAYAGEDQTICPGELVTLTATAEGGDSYLWSTGETTASIAVNPLEDTTYTVVVSNNFCSHSDDVTVFAVPAPELSLSDNVVIINGNSTTLEVSGADSYLWSTGETTPSITVNPNETTTYSVTGYSENGCESIAQVIVTVAPQLVANAGNDVSICAGESITLNATGGNNYLWNTGETSASIALTPTTTTTYTVTVSDNQGNSDSDTVTIIVNELPILSISEAITIFEGESTVLTVNGTDTYLWNTGETSNAIEVSPSETTTYSVTGISASNCETSQEVTVTVLPEVNANAGNDISICAGESIILNATGGSSYLWNTGETTASITLVPTTTSTYTVTVSDEQGNSDSDNVTVIVNELPSITVSENITISIGESTNLEANGAETFIWSTGDTTNSIVVNPTQTTTYAVSGSIGSCSSEQAQITVTVLPLFSASAGTDEYVCDNQSSDVILTANEGDSYLWSTGETTQSIEVNPLSTTSYTVTVTLEEQAATDDVTVYVDPSPNVVVANGESVEILNGDFITLSASGANHYEWNNGATQPNIAVSPSITTTYEVRGFIGECYDNKQVTVNVLQPVIADAGEDVQICLDEMTTLTANGGEDYVWSTGETTQSIQVSPDETTDYMVTVFNNLDFDEATVRVEVDANCAEDLPIPTGIQKDFKFNVFPNPATDIVNIKFSGVLTVSDVNIFDVTGKLVHRTKILNENIGTSTTKQIDISSLQSGVYFVKLIGQAKDITEKLLVR
ncbi:T9SS type A sorting domain-containing protein [Winogradskyella bathintestinalis]|uniref:Ig-like domain-containing protein n=1 Tax=Winogradskyella bathintestinalis TaxID=3035208 RepID=A0ABT7ZY37_9FLAO|nr:T9SS type A sorting domain-containing protein [Winogradskyella bathintestinalis]MDN3493749.1 Ig-like domain-containing protein [Winogradskyella bathintestinalis]